MKKGDSLTARWRLGGPFLRIPFAVGRSIRLIRPIRIAMSVDAGPGAPRRDWCREPSPEIGTGGSGIERLLDEGTAARDATGLLGRPPISLAAGESIAHPGRGSIRVLLRPSAQSASRLSPNAPGREAGLS